MGQCPASQRRGLLAAFGLNFDVHVHEGYRGGSDSRNPRSMCQGVGPYFQQRFLHLAGKTADRTIIEPLRNGVLLGFFEALNGAILLQKIAFVFDFGLDGLEVVAG